MPRSTKDIFNTFTINRLSNRNSVFAILFVHSAKVTEIAALNRPVYTSLLLIVSSLLIACKAPESGETLGWKQPYFYWKLQNTELQSPIAMPIEGVQVQQLTDTWGAARGSDRCHEGIDIFAPRGTPVLSTTQGIVREVGTNVLGGKVVWVTGPSSSQHYYAHLEDYAPALREGDWLEVGELLGFVGNTGNAENTPPHLHYGIYLNDGATNPYPYLTAQIKKP